GLPSARGMAPTFLDIDEKRDIYQFDIEHTISDTHFGVGLRYESDTQDNSRNIARRPGEPTLQRFVTQEDKVDTDIFNVHVFQETWFGEKVLFSTGYSFTRLDTDISGSRIYGSDYDPMYDPGYAHRQNHDEGFLDLSGGSGVDQHVANVN